jgi:hypothetical protein
MQNLKTFKEIKESLILEQDGKSHEGLGNILKELKPFGFSLDMKSFGVPTVYKGNDSDGVIIQFKQKTEKNPDLFQVTVSVNGKNVLFNTYTIKNSLSPSIEVSKILKDLEEWKKYQFKNS